MRKCFDFPKKWQTRTGKFPFPGDSIRRIPKQAGKIGFEPGFWATNRLDGVEKFKNLIIKLVETI